MGSEHRARGGQPAAAQAGAAGCGPRVCTRLGRLCSGLPAVPGSCSAAQDARLPSQVCYAPGGRRCEQKPSDEKGAILLSLCCYWLQRITPTSHHSAKTWIESTLRLWFLCCMHVVNSSPTQKQERIQKDMGLPDTKAKAWNRALLSV